MSAPLSKELREEYNVSLDNTYKRFRTNSNIVKGPLYPHPKGRRGHHCPWLQQGP